MPALPSYLSGQESFAGFTFLLAKADPNKKASGLDLNVAFIINLLEAGLSEKSKVQKSV